MWQGLGLVSVYIGVTKSYCMYASKSGIIDLRKPSKIGVITYTESHTGQTKQVDVSKQFWNYRAYLPNQQEVYDFLENSGYTHVLNPKFTWIM